MKPRLAQAPLAVLCLAVLSFAFVAPRLGHLGTNIVTETYRQATLRFFSGQSPFGLMPGGDFFLYSPFFCLIYAPFAWLPLKTQALAWGLFNVSAFWAGLFCWIGKDPKWKALKWPLVLGLVIASMELNISLLYQQMNAFLIGLILWGVASYRDKRWGRAGIILGLASGIKVLPFLFAVLLLFPGKRRYWVGLGGGLLLAFLLPALIVNPFRDWQLFQEWIVTLRGASTMVRASQLDIVSTASRMGFGEMGISLKWVVAIISLALMANERRRPSPRWEPWLALGVCFLLLLSPRSESPTFVLLAPAYPLLLAYLGGEERSPRRTAMLVTLFMAAGMVTLIFTDLWPRAIPNVLRDGYLGKTLGTLVLWGLAAATMIPRNSSPPPHAPRR